MDAVSVEKAVDTSTGAERPAKARITRSDGSTVIGHMEVGVMLVTYCPPPPSLPPLSPLTHCCMCNTGTHTVATDAAADGEYALLLLLGG